MKQIEIKLWVLKRTARSWRTVYFGALRGGYYYNKAIVEGSEMVACGFVIDALMVQVGAALVHVFINARPTH